MQSPMPVYSNINRSLEEIKLVISKSRQLINTKLNVPTTITRSIVMHSQQPQATLNVNLLCRFLGSQPRQTTEPMYEGTKIFNQTYKIHSHFDANLDVENDQEQSVINQPLGNSPLQHSKKYFSVLERSPIKNLELINKQQFKKNKYFSQGPKIANHQTEHKNKRPLQTLNQQTHYKTQVSQTPSQNTKDAIDIRRFDTQQMLISKSIEKLNMLDQKYRTFSKQTKRYTNVTKILSPRNVKYNNPLNTNQYYSHVNCPKYKRQLEDQAYQLFLNKIKQYPHHKRLSPNKLLEIFKIFRRQHVPQNRWIELINNNCFY